MTVSALTVLIVGTTAVVVGLGMGWAYKTANRLDRLHVRVDLAWQSLDAALARRSVVARTIASGMGSSGNELIRAADAAERADRPDRESAENAVSMLLAGTDTSTMQTQIVAELVDAETRIMMSRRFYNDAVRDTRALRDRLPVRWLRLAGTARQPQFIEIVERTES